MVCKNLDAVKHKIKIKDGCIVPSTQFTSPKDIVYVSFISFYRLRKNYLTKIGYYDDLQSNNFDYIIDFINENPDLLNKITYFGAVVQGTPLAPIWVSTKTEFNTYRRYDTAKDDATNVMVVLGLQPDIAGLAEFPTTGDMFFMIEYPKDLELTCYQPTSLNKNWIDAKKDLFLSFIKQDYFGRSYATDSSCLRGKEQIHEPIKCKDRNIQISYIGQYDKNLKVNKSQIFSEGKKRFEL